MQGGIFVTFDIKFKVKFLTVNFMIDILTLQFGSFIGFGELELLIHSIV